jgi:hypothetical protein
MIAQRAAAVTILTLLLGYMVFVVIYEYDNLSLHFTILF